MAASMTSTRKSASAWLKHMGGLMRNTLPWMPPLPMRMPASFMRSMHSASSPLAGSFVVRSLTNSTPSMSPSPRTSPIMSCLACSARSRALRWPPTCLQCSCRRSWSTTRSTARPPALHTGLPPYVLKCSLPAMEAAISGVVTTAARGRPLPMPLAMVTMSGVTPWFWKPQYAEPVRPNPVCTSSAMQMPPASRMILYTSGR
mmetsp:Transcript_27549/g.70159  ORF Transcript_27549/g.70159 Transcript_27549/m.70159 type:complete len:202 (+) Transcript_27549:459-1064(+)